MRVILILHIAIALLFSSCTTTDNINPNLTLRDSVLKQYVDYTSQLPYFFDESNYDYRFLKAYYTNDTMFLKWASNEIEIDGLKERDGFPEDCRRHPIIGKLVVDEVYQLNYTESFCDLAFYLTVTNKADSVSLHSIIYRLNNQDSSCQTVKEITTTLTPQNWDDFVRLIAYADFWGLNQYKPFGCCDGDFLTVKAIVRNRSDHSIVRQHKVARQFVSNTALFKSYELLIKLANFKPGCKY